MCLFGKENRWHQMNLQKLSKLILLGFFLLLLTTFIFKIIFLKLKFYLKERKNETVEQIFLYDNNLKLFSSNFLFFKSKTFFFAYIQFFFSFYTKLFSLSHFLCAYLKSKKKFKFRTIGLFFFVCLKTTMKKSCYL